MHELSILKILLLLSEKVLIIESYLDEGKPIPESDELLGYIRQLKDVIRFTEGSL